MSPLVGPVPVAGLVRWSSVDWPGKNVATVFLQGCPWQCVYCHNPSLINPRKPAEMWWTAVMAFLRRRQGLLDGVVFSGGEPTLSEGLPEAIAEVKKLGFAVGLHTAGSLPTRFARVLPQVDWVGLDIKAMPEDYPQVVRRPGTEKAWRSLDILLASNVDYEIRTTIYPESPTADRLVEIATTLKEKGVKSFVVQEARSCGTEEGFQADGPGWTETVETLVAEVRTLGFERFEHRRSS